MVDETNPNENYNTDEDVTDILEREMADKVRNMRHGDGVLTNNKQGGGQSVVQKMATAVTDIGKEYRQALLLGAFMSMDEADKTTAAIAECQRYGVDITPIIDRVVARAAVAGVKGGRLEAIIEALTHTSFTTNNPAAYKRAQERASTPTGKRSPIGED